MGLYVHDLFAMGDCVVPRVVLKLYVAGRRILAVFVAVWAVYALWMIVNAPRLHADYQRRPINEISDENWLYCAKWGFIQGTHEYNLCHLDLDEIRMNERGGAFNSTTVGVLRAYQF